MKKFIQKIIRITLCESHPVIDATTGQKEIPVCTKLFGFTVHTTYKPA